MTWIVKTRLTNYVVAWLVLAIEDERKSLYHAQWPPSIRRSYSLISDSTFYQNLLLRKSSATIQEKGPFGWSDMSTYRTSHITTPFSQQKQHRSPILLHHNNPSHHILFRPLVGQTTLPRLFTERRINMPRTNSVDSNRRIFQPRFR